MNTVLLMSAWLAPLLASLAAIGARGRYWMPAAALPALAAAWLVPAGTFVEVPWLLLGVRFGLDPTAQVFLGLAAVLWLAAGLYAAGQLRSDPHAARFGVFFLLAMSGNFALIVGQDLVSFYLGFALMGLAAYGLVVHEGNARVRRAGRVYLAMTLVGEVALFAAFLLLYQRTGSLTPPAEAMVGAGPAESGLLILAFGIKAGLIGLHMWLPLAHPAAPVPASAVLSGVMIKAALIGWMRYLPLGQVALPEVGVLLVVAGVATALLAVLLGLGQREPKVILAYSSIGKMGTMIAALGMAAREPALAPGLVAAVTVYAVHHGVAKAALFLGVGVVKSTTGIWPHALLAVLALVLVGAPFTSGALAKQHLTAALADAPPGWVELLTWALPPTAFGTMLLMGRFLYLMSGATSGADSVRFATAAPWLGLVLVSLSLPLFHGGFVFVASDAWPILAGAALVLVVVLKRPAGLAGWVGRVPPGDILEPLTRAAARSGGALDASLSSLGSRCTDAFGRIRGVRSVAWRETTASLESLLGGRVMAAASWLIVAGTALLLTVLWR